MNTKLERKLKDLPASPGVYFHKSAEGEVLYVGKAAVLKNRVRQYFQSQREMDIKTRALVTEIADVDWIRTESEIDALFLESEMVKRYKPRFNVLLRDDKSQTYIRIDMYSKWPCVNLTRQPIDDGAEYFGPYYNSFAVKKALRYLRRVFPFFTKPPLQNRRSDLDAHIGLSPSQDMTSEEYKASLRKLSHYFEGGRKKIVKDIEKEMHAAASRQDFETAASLRNRLRDLAELQQKIMFGDKEFLDISSDKALRGLEVLFGLKKIPSRIEGFDISHIGGLNVVASMVVFTNGVSNRAEYRKFKLKIQQNNDTANMYETISRRFSPKNIKSWGMPDLILIDGGKGQLSSAIKALKDCQVSVPAVSIAKREEEIIVHQHDSCLDTTTIQNIIKHPSKNEYVEQSGEFYVLNLHPGQRNAGAHSKNLRAGSVSNSHTDIVRLLQRIRDESHRFAVSYHSVLKKKKQTESDIEKIPGIGPVTRRKLIRKFGSIRAVKSATYNELVQIVGKNRADKIRLFM